MSVSVIRQSLTRHGGAALASPPPLAEEGQGGGRQKDLCEFAPKSSWRESSKRTPSPPLPRKRGREQTESAARDDTSSDS